MNQAKDIVEILADELDIENSLRYMCLDGPKTMDTTGGFDDFDLKEEGKTTAEKRDSQLSNWERLRPQIFSAFISRNIVDGDCGDKAVACYYNALDNNVWYFTGTKMDVEICCEFCDYAIHPSPAATSPLHSCLTLMANYCNSEGCFNRAFKKCHGCKEELCALCVGNDHQQHNLTLCI